MIHHHGVNIFDNTIVGMFVVIYLHQFIFKTVFITNISRLYSFYGHMLFYVQCGT